MFGIGPVELLIVLVIAVLAFGGPVLVFLLGYQFGRKSASRGDDREVVAKEPKPRESAQAPAEGAHAKSLKEEAEEAWEEYAEDE